MIQNNEIEVLEVETPHEEEEEGDIEMVPAASDDISDTTLDDKIVQEYLDYQEKFNSKVFSKLNDKVSRKAFLKTYFVCSDEYRVCSLGLDSCII